MAKARSQAFVRSYVQNKLSWDFPGGPMVKNPPSNALDMGSIPGTKIPHASGQLSPHATMKTQHSKQKTTSSHSPAALPSLCTCCYRSVPTYLHGFPSDSVVKNLPAMQERQV